MIGTSLFHNLVGNNHQGKFLESMNFSVVTYIIFFLEYFMPYLNSQYCFFLLPHRQYTALFRTIERIFPVQDSRNVREICTPFNLEYEIACNLGHRLMQCSSSLCVCVCVCR